MADYVPKTKKEVKRKSASAFYWAAAVFLAYSDMFPLYTLWHFLLAAAVTAAVFFVLDSKATVKVEYVDKTDKELATGNEELDEMLKSARSQIAALNQYGLWAIDEEVKRHLMRITTTAGKIADYVAENPDRLPEVRRLFGYFLPTTMKLMDNYKVIKVQDVKGENASATVQKIEDMLGKIADAFEYQLDALFAKTAMDVAADISVMESLMAQQGMAAEEETPVGEEGIRLQL